LNPGDGDEVNQLSTAIFEPPDAPVSSRRFDHHENLKYLSTQLTKIFSAVRESLSPFL
jgi:hypothetical protein